MTGDPTLTERRFAGRVVGVFDAGIGGLPIARALTRRLPGVAISYLADSGRRPYGPQPGATVARYVRQAERFFAGKGVDVWVIACNTASVVAPATNERLVPCVDMVEAVGRVLPPVAAGRVALLGTLGTIVSGAIPRAYPDHDWVPMPTEALLRHAEEGDARSPAVLDLLRRLRDEVDQSGATHAVLACTDYTCILPAMADALPGIALLDPLDGAVRAVCDIVRSRSTDEAPTAFRESRGHEFAVTGHHPVDIPTLARETYGLEFTTTVTINLELTES
ncbi:aspartate/glutamate racemase family protein [Micromonospora sp. NBC_01655]|uniref:glutamate racemase n=1 Tax=Micromonospora sp. NBC_01655 TaxID=2975983 RepID=UPI00224CFF20|nr:aspartate/glutamate racemase family protein [Micromonospora sp. NBC_01655]MCX4469599.1 aspartate/glutamate racemase family protein [Micromonospora sp. NBC_01655]